MRIASEVALHRVLDSGRIMMWAMDDELFSELIQRRPRPGEQPWWFSKLMQAQVPRIVWPDALFEEVLMAIDEEVKKTCMA